MYTIEQIADKIVLGKPEQMIAIYSAKAEDRYNILKEVSLSTFDVEICLDSGEIVNPDNSFITYHSKTGAIFENGTRILMFGMSQMTHGLSVSNVYIDAMTAKISEYSQIQLSMGPCMPRGSNIEFLIR